MQKVNIDGWEYYAMPVLEDGKIQIYYISESEQKKILKRMEKHEAPELSLPWLVKTVMTWFGVSKKCGELVENK